MRSLAGRFASGLPLFFSLAFTLSAMLLASSNTKISVESFEGKDASLTSLGWKGGNLEDGKKDFYLVTEKSNTFLRSDYKEGEAKYLYKQFDWDSSKLPCLRWRWRVQQFPKGALINDSKKSDAGAQLYVLWRYFPRYYVLKYYWASSDPVDTLLKEGNAFLGFVVGRVLRSGPPLNEWKSEIRNIHEDYLKGFENPPPGNVRGIAFLSDGDETKSPARGDLDDVEAFAGPCQ